MEPKAFCKEEKKKKKKKKVRVPGSIFFINDLPLENEGSFMAHKPRKQFDSLIPEWLFKWSYYHPQPRYEWNILSYWWGTCLKDHPS